MHKDSAIVVMYRSQADHNGSTHRQDDDVFSEPHQGQRPYNLQK
jgi:hypothetical protein